MGISKENLVWIPSIECMVDSTASDSALERLCNSYWPPLYAYVRRRVVHRLQRDMERGGKGRQFELLKHFLSGENSDLMISDVAEELSQTESATRMAASRMRKRYRELLRDEIAQTLSTNEDVEDEIRSLFSAFQS